MRCAEFRALTRGEFDLSYATSFGGGFGDQRVSASGGMPIFGNDSLALGLAPAAANPPLGWT